RGYQAENIGLLSASRRSSLKDNESLVPSQLFSTICLHPSGNLSSRSRDITTSKSSGMRANALFLASSKRNGVITVSPPNTPFSFRRATVLSVDPVSSTEIRSAPAQDATKSATLCSSFL